MSRFSLLPEFEKELKQLGKKYRTLGDDLERLEEVLCGCPMGVGKNFVIIHSSSAVKVVKVRLACRALRDRSLRVIYGYLEGKGTIEFVELYFKGDKQREDRERIREYVKRFEKA